MKPAAPSLLKPEGARVTKQDNKQPLVTATVQVNKVIEDLHQFMRQIHYCVDAIQPLQDALNDLTNASVKLEQAEKELDAANNS
jgi:uncharacterized membrane protein